MTHTCIPVMGSWRQTDPQSNKMSKFQVQKRAFVSKEKEMEAERVAAEGVGEMAQRLISPESRGEQRCTPLVKGSSLGPSIHIG